jgi:hypothetical protein
LTPEQQYILRRTLRQRFGGISAMTLWRWERDGQLGFPQALIINGRKYYDLREIEGWERSRAGAPLQHAQRTRREM